MSQATSEVLRQRLCPKKPWISQATSEVLRQRLCPKKPWMSGYKGGPQTMFVSQEAMDFRLLLPSLISAGEPSEEEIKRHTAVTASGQTSEITEACQM